MSEKTDKSKPSKIDYPKLARMVVREGVPFSRAAVECGMSAKQAKKGPTHVGRTSKPLRDAYQSELDLKWKERVEAGKKLTAAELRAYVPQRLLELSLEGENERTGSGKVRASELLAKSVVGGEKVGVLDNDNVGIGILAMTPPPEFALRYSLDYDPVKEAEKEKAERERRAVEYRAEQLRDLENFRRLNPTNDIIKSPDEWESKK